MKVKHETTPLFRPSYGVVLPKQRRTFRLPAPHSFFAFLRLTRFSLSCAALAFRKRSVTSVTLSVTRQCIECQLIASLGDRLTDKNAKKLYVVYNHIYKFPAPLIAKTLRFLQLLSQQLVSPLIMICHSLLSCPLILSLQITFARIGEKYLNLFCSSLTYLYFCPWILRIP